MLRMVLFLQFVLTLEAEADAILMDLVSFYQQCFLACGVLTPSGAVSDQYQEDPCPSCQQPVPYLPHAPLSAICSTCALDHERCSRTLQLLDLLDTGHSIARCPLCSNSVLLPKVGGACRLIDRPLGVEQPLWRLSLDSELCQFCCVPMRYVD